MLLRYLGILRQDLRYAARLLRIAPGTTIIGVASLALGIGACTTIFSVVHAVLLDSGGYREPSRLVVLWESNTIKGIPKTPVAPATFYNWRKENRSFEQLELVAPGSPVTVSGGIPERVNIQYATPGLLPLLGVTPVVGHAFNDSDLDESNSLVISYGYAQRRFGSASAVLGQKLIVNGAVHTIAGVLPPQFHLFDEKADIWLPIKPEAGSNDYSGRSWTIAVGRVRPGVDIKTAQAEMNVIAAEIAHAHPDTNQDWGVRVESIQEAQFAYWKPILTLLFGSVLFVLLICCTNVANLLLGRMPVRRREISLRVSLGAGRSRIALQLLHEGLLLGLLGGAFGVLLAIWGVRLFVAIAPADFPMLHNIAINRSVIVFAVFVSFISGIIFSIAPAIVGVRADLLGVTPAMRSTPDRSQRRFSTAFVGAEVAISVVLLSGAALMLASILKLLRIDPGFRSERVLTMQVFLTGRQYIENVPGGVHISPAVSSFYRRLLDRVQVIPAVESAGLVAWLPEGGYNTGRRDRAFRITGETTSKESEPRALFNIVSSGYFRTLQIGLAAGRYIDASDDENTPWVAVVNSAFVRRYWSGQDPIGKQLITDGGFDEKPREVVGVVADVRQNTLEQEPQPEIFASFRQQPVTNFAHGYQNRVHMSLLLRTRASQEFSVAAVRKIAAELDADQPLYDVRSMPEVLSASLATRTLYTRWFELFAAMALFISVMGVYSLVSQSVTERTKEVGIRIAVGANEHSILGLFVRQASVPLLCGSVVGLLLAHFSNRTLGSMLFAVSPDSASVSIGILALFLVVAGAAIFIPALRSTRIDVVEALRYE